MAIKHINERKKERIIKSGLHGGFRSNSYYNSLYMSENCREIIDLLVKLLGKLSKEDIAVIQGTYARGRRAELLGFLKQLIADNE